VKCIPIHLKHLEVAMEAVAMEAVAMEAVAMEAATEAAAQTAEVLATAVPVYGWMEIAAVGTLLIVSVVILMEKHI
jgi:hypothetical protein